ncbi:MAG TPA: hypothetical protein VK457_20635, partial [Chloroflexota bacterium]|nr:hypothetical protein [Chloroflexota bacterium]
DFISQYQGKIPERKGSAILSSLTHEMGPFEYRKKVHGPQIAQALSVATVEDLRSQFEAFFGP